MIGIIKKIDALEVAKVAFKIGCGRKTKESKIDYFSGIELLKKENDEMIQKALSQNSNIHLEKIDIIEKENINIVKGINDKTITILPDENFEGFYIAKLVK